MPDLDHEKNSPYPFLNKLNTETLKQILQVDFESEDSDTPENDEFITCVMEVIAQREAETAKYPDFDVDAGWKDFRQNYQPTEEDMAKVYDPTSSNRVISIENPSAQKGGSSNPANCCYCRNRGKSLYGGRKRP